MSYLVSLHQSKPPARIGSKAANLHRLWRKKYPIPATFVCTWDAYQDYLVEPRRTLDRLADELTAALDPVRVYAVRSSANLEDGSDHSYAGQFTSLLDVSGADRLLQAVQTVWQAAHSGSVQSYRPRAQQTAARPLLPPAAPLRMAVIIQEMVAPRYSGVAFSRNPITGQDEIIVEAVCGPGTLLMQDGLTPLRWVQRWGAFMEVPVEHPLPAGLIDQVAQQTSRIALAFHQEVDLEWVFDGQSLYWVQLRPITALAAVDVYSNRLAREMSPGLIKPLVWSISIPLHSRQWARILTQLVGDLQLEPERLVKAFHYRAYYNMGHFGRVFASLGLPRDALERMMGTLPPGVKRPRFRPGLSILAKIPRLAVFLFSKLGYHRRAEQAFQRYEQTAHILSAPLPAAASPSEWLARLDLVVQLQEKITYYTIQVILFMQIYHGLLRSRLKARQVDPDQYDLTGQWERLQAYDPNFAIADLHNRLHLLPATLQARLCQGDLPALEQEPALVEFRAYYQHFLDRFGHLSDSTVNFTNMPWRESPQLLLRLICDFSLPIGPARPALPLADVARRGPDLLLIRFLCQRARRFRLLREMYGSLYTYTLMLLRDQFHALGDQLVQAGLLSDWQEIFLLYLPELRAWADSPAAGSDFPVLVRQRQDEMDHCRHSLTPEVIYGDRQPPIYPADADILTGIPTAPGYYAGPVKVVCGLADFARLDPGDVLVIPYSDVSWTPLFARAGAVIAESGGILSHSSIVAREYQIPAVVSVPGAMQLTDGQRVEVDGFKGIVYLQPSAAPPPPESSGGVDARIAGQ